MVDSHELARLIGPVLTIIGAGALLNAEYYRGMVRNAADNPVMISQSGAMALLLGMLTVHVHNLWVWHWPVLMTLLGWLLVVRGVFRTLFPELAIRAIRKSTGSTGPILVSGALSAVFGLILTAFGFSA